MSKNKFLKPTLGKILLSILIGIIPLYKQTICPFVPPCFNEWYLTFSAITNFLDKNILGSRGFIGKIQLYQNLLPDFVSYLLEYIISVFVIYLISCFIIYVYQTSQNKNSITKSALNYKTHQRLKIINK